MAKLRSYLSTKMSTLQFILVNHMPKVKETKEGYCRATNFNITKSGSVCIQCILKRIILQVFHFTSSILNTQFKVT